MTHRIPLGPFELHRRIGRGGMGEVWEGLHVPQQIGVAVKVLTHRGVRRDTFVEAFRNEVRGLAGLNHPGIVTVLDYGEMPAGAAKLSEGMFEANSPYIVMELARRGSLKKYVDAVGWRQIKTVLFTILDALAHAHAAGVIHRDLKPANILVGCGTDGHGVKLTDFGLAHAIDQHEFARSTDSGWGTPQFMAPEQYRAAWRDYGPWTDLYALGVMTYYLCAGHYPYEAEDTGSWSRAHQLGTPAPFRSRFDVPSGFEGWLDRLMQKHPRDRYQFAADAAWALQKLGDPPNARHLRETVSMIPHLGDRDYWLSEERVPGGATAAYGPAQRQETMVERPATTKLMEELGVVFDTATMTADDGAPSESGPLSAVLSRDEVPPLPYTWERPRVAESSPKLLGAGLGLFGLRTVPMVDRESERDVLWETLHEVHDSGTAHAVIVRGPAGTGKTRLARWLCRRAHEVGCARVLKVAFSPIAGPGDGLSRMVAQQLRAGGMDVGGTVDRVEQQLRFDGVRDEEEIAALTRFVMPLSSTSPEMPALGVRINGPNERYSLLLRHLTRLAQDRAVIVWFDDVQWGADALAFAQHVVERQHHSPTPAMFVMTLRNEALVQRAVETALVGELARNRRTRVLDVEPLRPEDTSQLVRELLHLAPSLANEVGRRCAGNPLFAVQLVGDWVAGGKLRFGTDGFELKKGVEAEIPDNLHAMWRERLALLLRRRPPSDLLALEVAAALGMSVELEEWYLACAECGVSASPDLLRELLETGLAQQTDYGFEFCHGLFRESLARSTEEMKRQEDVHMAAVRMLEVRYPTQAFPFAERYAQHIVAAGEGRLAIVPLWVAARARIDRSEFEIALSLLDARDRLLEELGFDTSAHEWSLGWATRARVHLWLGQYGEVEAFASRAAVEARRHGWPEILARATVTEGLGHLYRGELEKAQRAFERASGEFDRLNDEIGLGQCLHGLGRVAHGRGALSAAEACFQRAYDLMVRVDNALGQAQCLNALGDLERDRENWEAALDYAHRARELFEARSNSIGIADCVNDIAELHRLRGELEEARETCIDALRRYEALGSEHAMHVRMNLALTLHASGAAPQARQLLDEVRVRFEQTEQDAPLALVNMLLVPILVDLDEVDLARRRYDEARPIALRHELRDRDAADAIELAASRLEALGHEALASQMRAFAAIHLRLTVT